MAKLILAVNTGSTSTKLGIFEGYNEIVRKTIHHKRGDLEGFEKVIDQKGFRLKYICDFLLSKQINPGDIDAVVGRGGDRKSTRLNSSHVRSSYAVFCLK